jgi:hypothetical protein
VKKADINPDVIMAEEVSYSGPSPIRVLSSGLWAWPKNRIKSEGQPWFRKAGQFETRPARGEWHSAEVGYPVVTAGGNTKITESVLEAMAKVTLDDFAKVTGSPYVKVGEGDGAISLRLSVATSLTKIGRPYAEAKAAYDEKEARRKAASEEREERRKQSRAWQEVLKGRFEVLGVSASMSIADSGNLVVTMDAQAALRLTAEAAS